MESISLAEQILLNGCTFAFKSTFMAPLMSVRNLQQTSLDIDLSSFQATREILQCKGFNGLWDGSQYEMLKFIPLTLSKALLPRRLNLFPDSLATIWLTKTINASVTISANAIPSYPLDVLSFMYSMPYDKEELQHGVRIAFQYPGFCCYVLSSFIYHVSLHSVHELFESYLGPQSGVWRLVAALTKVVIAQFISYPFDTIRKHLIIDALEQEEKDQYSGWIECAGDIYDKDGLRGFFKAVHLGLLGGVTQRFTEIILQSLVKTYYVEFRSIIYE